MKSYFSMLILISAVFLMQHPAESDTIINNYNPRLTQFQTAISEVSNSIKYNTKLTEEERKEKLASINVSYNDAFNRLTTLTFQNEGKGQKFDEAQTNAINTLLETQDPFFKSVKAKMSS